MEARSQPETACELMQWPSGLTNTRAQDDDAEGKLRVDPKKAMGRQGTHEAHTRAKKGRLRDKHNKRKKRRVVSMRTSERQRERERDRQRDQERERERGRAKGERRRETRSKRSKGGGDTENIQRMVQVC